MNCDQLNCDTFNFRLKGSEFVTESQPQFQIKNKILVWTPSFYLPTYDVCPYLFKEEEDLKCSVKDRQSLYSKLV